MDFDINKSLDSVQEGTREVAEIAHKKAYEFHSHFVSKTIPKGGKFGNVAKFSAELIPGVSEYNAIREGNWKEFAIAAGVDVVAIGAGVFTGGAGTVAVKGGAAGAKLGVKKAVKEIAEVGAKKALKETAETGAKKTIGAETERAVKKAVETGSEKVVKETTEKGVEKASKEVAETGAEKAIKETKDESVKKATKLSDKPREILTKNHSLEGDKHPITGVPFERRIVTLPGGEKIEGVFAKFDSLFDAKIPKEAFKASDKVQFKECNKQLLEAIERNPEMKKKFTKDQIEQIREGVHDGSAPDGFVWHHDTEAGKIQLVDEATHAKTGHDGGRMLWGGGSEYR